MADDPVLVDTRAKVVRWRTDPIAFVREELGGEPDKWQANALRLLPRAKGKGGRARLRLALIACKGPGKAQPVKTIVDTPSGRRMFGDLRVGDEVFAVDGSRVRITAVYPRGRLPMVRVFFDDGSSTVCCEEHLWRVRGRTERRHGTWSVLTTRQIINRGVREKNGRWNTRQFEIPRHGAVDYPRAELQLDPYVLGVWLGDGGRKSARYATKPTPEIQAEIERRGYKVTAHEKSANVHGLAKQLRAIGVFDLYSHQRFVPQEYMRSSPEQRRSILCGLMDTDGGIGDDGHMEFAVTSLRLCEDVVWLVRSLGGAAWIKETIKKAFYYGKDRERIDGKDCYRVSVVLPFNPFTVPHRAARWRKPQDRYLTRYIDRIETVEREEAVCIAIDHESHCYLTNDFIVTHNSTALSWAGWWILTCWQDSQGIACSITSDNLRDGLWKELSLWRGKSEFLTLAFSQNTERIQSTSPGHESTWFLSARSFPKQADKDQQANTLAGLHASHVFTLLDEAGDYPDGVVAAAEGIFSNVGIDAWLLMAGNPTRSSGPLFNASNRDRRLWELINITGDPDDHERSPRIDPEWARDQIRQWGRENPWVMCNILGLFPPTASDQLIGSDLVAAAQARDVPRQQHRTDPIIWGLDPARFGDDEASLCRRQGLVVRKFNFWRGLDGVELANRVAALVLKAIEDNEAPDQIFVDVGGVGSSVFDHLVHLGYGDLVTPVDFGGGSDEPDKYANKRTEIWFSLAWWIKKLHVVLPVDNVLAGELTAPTFEFRVISKRTVFQLESKDSMKARGVPSPNRADALALTFSAPVSPVGRREKELHRRSNRALTEYDPYVEG